MLERYEEFTTKINLAYKYIMKIKIHEMNNLDLKAANLNVLFYLGKNYFILSHKFSISCNAFLSDNKSPLSYAE